MVKIALYPPNSLILADLLERRGHTPLVLQKQIRQKIKDPEIDSPPMNITEEDPIKGLKYAAIEEIRKLDPNHIFTKERGFAPGDPRRCRGHRFGPREGFHQMEKEYRILGFVSEALENPKDVTVEEKKPVKVDDFKKIMYECLENRE